LHSSGPNAIRL